MGKGEFHKVTKCEKLTREDPKSGNSKCHETLGITFFNADILCEGVNTLLRIDRF